MPDKTFIGDYLPYLLARASHRVSAEFHRQAKAAGISVAEWRVLATLSDGAPSTIGRLADDVLFQQPTLTKIIDRMEAEGLVARVAGKHDRRQRLVAITPKGGRIAAPLLRRAKRHEQRVLEGIGAKEAAILKSMLRRLMARGGR